jgi:FxsC-like protein
VIDRGSPAENAARGLLRLSTVAQMDDLRFRLNLSLETSSREAAPASQQLELWLAAKAAGGTRLADLDELLCEQQGKHAPAYWLNVSCATGEKDATEYERFFSRLCAKLKARGICPNEDLRHLDLIRSPDPIDWPSWSLRAMQECRVLLCLYTRDYFDGTYCGKIWGAFLDRLKAELGLDLSAGNPPPLIIPILWGPPEENPDILPRVVRTVPVPQFTFDPEYQDRGLLFLQKLAVAKREGYEMRYDAVLDAIADQVQAEVQLHALHRDLDIPPLSEILDVFHEAPSGPGTAVSGTAPYARFVFFVATKQRISVIRDPASYGNEPEHWRPYSPQSEDILQWTAMSCSRELGRTAWVICLDSAFLDNLRSADRRGEPIIVIADPWTIHARIYSTYEQDYDSAQLSCTRLLVCWNDKDGETSKHWSKLRETLKKSAFPAKYSSVYPEKIREEVVSWEQFKREVTTAILSSHAQILDEVKDQRVATGHPFLRPPNLGTSPSNEDAPPEPVRIARTDPVRFISLPQMQGPVGGPEG